MVTKNEILDSIKAIDTTIQESEISVLTAMADSYGKAITLISESTDDSVLECYMMESWNDDEFEGSDTNVSPKESIIKKILLFLPRLLIKIGRLIKTKLTENKKITKNEFDQKIGQLTKIIEEDRRENDESIFDINLDLSNLDSDILQMKKQIKDESDKRTKEASDINSRIDRNEKKFNAAKEDVDTYLNYLDKHDEQNQKAIEDLKNELTKTNRLISYKEIKSGYIYISADMDECSKYISIANEYINSLKNIDINNPSTLSKILSMSINKLDRSLNNFNSSKANKDVKYKYSLTQLKDVYGKLYDELTKLDKDCEAATTKFNEIYKSYVGSMGDNQKDDISKSLHKVTINLESILDDVSFITRLLTDLYDSATRLVEKANKVIPNVKVKK